MIYSSCVLLYFILYYSSMSYLSFVLTATNLTLATHDRDTHTINTVPLSVRYVINDVVYLADFFMNKTRSNLNYDDTCTLLARE